MPSRHKTSMAPNENAAERRPPPEQQMPTRSGSPVALGCCNSPGCEEPCCGLAGIHIQRNAPVSFRDLASWIGMSAGHCGSGLTSMGPPGEEMVDAVSLIQRPARQVDPRLRRSHAVPVIVDQLSWM